MSINKFGQRFTHTFFAGELKEAEDLNTETEDLNDIFGEYMTEKMASLIVEDHEKSMTSEQMAAHIKKLFKMCDDESTEKKFLKRLGGAASVDDCVEKDITSCAKKLCDIDEDKCDDVIHELEGMVDYTSTPEKNSDDDDKKKKETDSDDDDDSEEQKGKKKVEEGVSVGSVVKTSAGKTMVVLGKLGGGDVAAVRIHHGKPLYRTQINLRSDEYIPTGQHLNVTSKKDLEKQQRAALDSRGDDYDFFSP